ncbi:MAG: iron-siderophore ABC transporter substrate-binding protein [Clostridia bacterium]|nr:iron-siderophore ABC transporter substrate-binding protein [Clostridia bacterium]
MNLNKTLLVILVGLMALVLIVAGCSNIDPSEGEKEKQTAQENSASRVFTHKFGETVLPEKLERIAVMDLRIADPMLALGVTPVGIVGTDKNYPEYIFEEMKDVPLLGEWPGDPEAYVKVEPDLIIGAWLDARGYETLSKIAPTINFEGDWRAFVPLVGEVLGKEEEAQKLMDEYYAKAEKARAELQQLVGDETFVLLRARGDMGFVSSGAGKEWAPGVFFHDLGLAHIEELKDDNHKQISLEILPEINPDHIIIEMLAWADGETFFNDQVKNSAVWNGLDAVKNDKVYIFDTELLNFGGVKGMQVLIDEFLKELTRKN